MLTTGPASPRRFALTLPSNVHRTRFIPYLCIDPEARALRPARHPHLSARMITRPTGRARPATSPCFAPQEDPSPGQRDIEEFSLKLLRVPVARLEEEILFGGEVLGPSLATAVLALRRLRKEGLLGPQPLL